MPDRPPFPSNIMRATVSTIGAFAALGALWVLPIAPALKIIVTALFFAVPYGAFMYWLGRCYERHHLGLPAHGVGVLGQDLRERVDRRSQRAS